MVEFLEIAMMILFGLSWPQNIIKSLKTKSPKGKSLAFLIFIDLGYVCGISAKLIAGGFQWYVLFFYILNFTMVTVDLILYLHYKRMEKRQKKAD